MIPRYFDGVNVRLAAEQDEYQTLPAHRTDAGVVTACWKLTRRERWRIWWTGQLWFSVWTFGDPIHPQLPAVDKPTWIQSPDPADLDPVIQAAIEDEKKHLTGGRPSEG